MMKSGNCFTVEYILGTRDNKPKESISKENLTDTARDGEKQRRTESKDDIQHDKVGDHEDHLIITSAKGKN